MWQSEDDIRCLVDQSSGLFIYRTTIIRYIGQDTNPFGPEEHLQLVLNLGREIATSDDNPLSALDKFYTLIMEQIPKAVLPNTLSLLCIHLNISRRTRYNPISYASLKMDGRLTSHSTINHLSTSWLASVRSGSIYCVNGPRFLRRCFDASTDFLYRASCPANFLVLPDPWDNAYLTGPVCVVLLV